MHECNTYRDSNSNSLRITLQCAIANNISFCILCLPNMFLMHFHSVDTICFLTHVDLLSPAQHYLQIIKHTRAAAAAAAAASIWHERLPAVIIDDRLSQNKLACQALTVDA